MLSIQIQNGHINGCDNKPCRYTHISYSTWYIPNASPSPSHLSYPTAGWKQEILRWNAGNFIFFTSWKSFFVLKFAINKKIRWVTKMLGEAYLFATTNCLIFENPAWVPTNPSAAAESTTTPPLEPDFSSVSAVFVMKTSRKTHELSIKWKNSGSWRATLLARISSHNKTISTDHLDEFWMLQKKWIIMNPNI